jgi:hypothetical protein
MRILSNLELQVVGGGDMEMDDNPGNYSGGVQQVTIIGHPDTSSGESGGGVSIVDGIAIGTAVGGALGLTAALTGSTLLGVGEAIAVAAVLGSGVGLIAAAAGIAAVAIYTAATHNGG